MPCALQHAVQCCLLDANGECNIQVTKMRACAEHRNAGLHSGLKDIRVRTGMCAVRAQTQAAVIVKVEGQPRALC